MKKRWSGFPKAKVLKKTELQTNSRPLGKHSFYHTQDYPNLFGNMSFNLQTASLWPGIYNTFSLDIDEFVP